MSQKERVLRHLKDYGTITSMEAFIDYGITRLSAIIFNLRTEGYDIESHMIHKKNRYGEMSHFALYEMR